MGSRMVGSAAPPSTKRRTSGTTARHCSTLAMKHVFPRLYRPGTPPRRCSMSTGGSLSMACRCSCVAMVGGTVTHEAALEEVSMRASERWRSGREADTGRRSACGEVVLMAEPMDSVDIIDAAVVPWSCIAVEHERRELADESVWTLPGTAGGDSGCVRVRECATLRVVVDMDAVRSGTLWLETRRWGSARERCMLGYGGVSWREAEVVSMSGTSLCGMDRDDRLWALPDNVM